MQTYIIAGATGYLGRHLVQKLQAQQATFHAIGRSREKLSQLFLSPAQQIEAEVTRPKSLVGKLPKADVLISTVGITRQKDGLTYMDVDYQANMHLLEAAKAAGIGKFMYVSAVNGQHFRHLKIFEAKERFVDALKASGMDYCIVRPNGFFSDMNDFLNMARQGSVYLFGDGQKKLNPIHGADVATGILEAADGVEQEFSVGGPDILTQNEIAALALQTWMRPHKIIHLPDWIRMALIQGVRLFTSQKTYGPIEFFLTMMGQDNIAPRYGTHLLKTYFTWEVDRINREG